MDLRHVCRSQTETVFLLSTVAKKEVHGEQGLELGCVLDLRDLCFGEFDPKGFRHGANMLDCLDTHYREDVRRLVHQIRQSLRVSVC